MSKKTQTAIDSKKSIRKSYGDHSAEYKIAKAETKKLANKGIFSKLERNCDELSQLPSNKQLLLAMRELNSKKRSISWRIEGKDGVVLTKKGDILEHWATF